MKKIYSKLEPEKLLHIIFNLNDTDETSVIIPDDNFLQCIVMKKDVGTKFRDHKHIYKKIDYDSVIAQESWFVFKGKIKVYHYDLDDTLLGTHELTNGDINITLFGGHTFEVLENDTIVLEHKNGPYYGQTLDKKFFL